MRLTVLLAGFSFIAAAGIADAQSSRWADASNGHLPRNAVRAGHEANGEPLYACRARHAGGLHIGKFRADWQGCNIPYGGKEIIVNRYEVLVR